MANIQRHQPQSLIDIFVKAFKPTLDLDAKPEGLALVGSITPTGVPIRVSGTVPWSAVLIASAAVVAGVGTYAALDAWA